MKHYLKSAILALGVLGGSHAESAKVANTTATLASKIVKTPQFAQCIERNIWHEYNTPRDLRENTIKAIRENNGVVPSDLEKNVQEKVKSCIDETDKLIKSPEFQETQAQNKALSDRESRLLRYERSVRGSLGTIHREKDGTLTLNDKQIATIDNPKGFRYITNIGDNIVSTRVPGKANTFTHRGLKGELYYDGKHYYRIRVETGSLEKFILPTTIDIKNPPVPVSTNDITIEKLLVDKMRVFHAGTLQEVKLLGKIKAICNFPVGDGTADFIKTSKKLYEVDLTTDGKIDFITGHNHDHISACMNPIQNIYTASRKNARVALTEKEQEVKDKISGDTPQK